MGLRRRRVVARYSVYRRIRTRRSAHVGKEKARSRLSMLLFLFLGVCHASGRAWLSLYAYIWLTRGMW
jgi:hypothetical protein